MRLPLLPIFPFFAILFLLGCGPNLARYQPLVDPAITVRPDERMLIVTGQGDPDGWMKEAISDLDKTWFKWKRQTAFPTPPRKRGSRKTSNSPIIYLARRGRSPRARYHRKGFASPQRSP